MTNFVDILGSRFSKKRKTVQRNIAFTILALIKSKNSSIPEIATQMGVMNQQTFHSNEMRINRLLQTDTFLVDDQLWRAHITIVFDLLKEREILQPEEKEEPMIPINVDYTAIEDRFLILAASIPFGKRGIPLYFSMRKYPKKKDQIELKKMEVAFLKELKHLLPRKHRYVIVADRGFGNIRFMNDCKTAGFEYIVRIPENRTWETSRGMERAKDKNETEDLGEIYLTSKRYKTRLVVHAAAKKTTGAWRIATSLEQSVAEAVVNQYAERFGIEKMFQDEKSSGFCIENTKIRKYDRFKKLYYLVFLAQALMIFIGDYINENADSIKKRLPLHINIISVFSN